LSLKGRALPQAVRSIVSQFTIYGRQSGIGTDFSPRTSIFPSQYNSTKTLELICICTPLLEERPAGEAYERLKKKKYFQQPESIGKKITSTLFSPLNG